MPKEVTQTTLGQKVALVVFPILLVILAVSAAELYCRWFTRINFVGIGRGLFVSHAFGDSYGNRPNFRGIAFGADVQIDPNGFRIDPTFPGANGATGTVLVLGDSVSFGVGVEASKTVIGRLQRANSPRLRFHNSSAIGYGLHDYANVAAVLVRSNPEIKYALLFYCLNDIYDTSAQEIEATVQEVNGTGTSPGPFSSLQAFAASINAFLRSRSKLYLFVKTALTDPAKRYFDQDLAEYKKPGLDIDGRLAPLREIAKIMAAHGVAFEVFVMPYEAQLRTTHAKDDLLPQTLVDDFLRKSGISYFDALTAFQQSGLPPANLYLYGDPMHLSDEGHRISFQFVNRELANLAKKRGLSRPDPRQAGDAH